jgi:hypothetical protein
MSSIYDFVKDQRDGYRSDTVEIADASKFSQCVTFCVAAAPRGKSDATRAQQVAKTYQETVV